MPLGRKLKLKFILGKITVNNTCLQRNFKCPTYNVTLWNFAFSSRTESSVSILWNSVLIALKPECTQAYSSLYWRTHGVTCYHRKCCIFMSKAVFTNKCYKGFCRLIRIYPTSIISQIGIKGKSDTQLYKSRVIWNYAYCPFNLSFLFQ